LQARFARPAKWRQGRGLCFSYRPFCRVSGRKGCCYLCQVVCESAADDRRPNFAAIDFDDVARIADRVFTNAYRLSQRLELRAQLPPEVHLQRMQM